MHLIRKISIGKDYKDNAMHYSVGQRVYGNHNIVSIEEDEYSYTIYIEKGPDTLKWKNFNKNMAISVEYNLEY